jgi:hypothetical protein
LDAFPVWDWDIFFVQEMCTQLEKVLCFPSPGWMIAEGVDADAFPELYPAEGEDRAGDGLALALRCTLLPRAALMYVSSGSAQMAKRLAAWMAEDDQLKQVRKTSKQ